MKKKILIMIIAALVCWLPGQALACDTFTSPINYNLTPSALPSDTCPYGNVTVTLNSSGSATVHFAMDNSPDYDFNASMASAFINVTGTNVNVSVFGEGNDWSLVTPTPVTASSTKVSASGLGSFNIGAQTTDSGTDYVTFTLTAALGTWANAASVLAFNSAGFDAGADVTDYNCYGHCLGTGYVGEGCPVPIPPSALLLGSGLLGLVGIGWRRKRN